MGTVSEEVGRVADPDHPAARPDQPSSDFERVVVADGVDDDVDSLSAGLREQVRDRGGVVDRSGVQVQLAR